MKITSILLSVVLLACSNPKTNNPTTILSEEAFSRILKDIHLAEGAFELNKTQDLKSARATLANNYNSICLKYKISIIDFENTLNYYVQHPKKLEKIYSSALENLKKERSTLNQK